MREVHEVLAAADHDDAQSEHTRVDDSNRGVFAKLLTASKPADTDRGEYRSDHGTGQQIPLVEVRDHDSRQSRVRDSLTEKGHSTQYDVHAQERTGRTDQQAGH